MRETTRSKLDKAFQKLGANATYKAIGKESGVSYKAISEYKKEIEISEAPLFQSEVSNPVSAPKRKSEPMGDITFFGLDDRKGSYNSETGVLEQSLNSRVTSEYPAWMITGEIENLKEDITREKEQIRLGIIDKGYIGDMKDRVKQKEAKLERILSSKPILRGGDKDTLKRTHDALGNEIRDAQFSGSQMDFSNDLATQEADRMTEPRMDIKSIPGMTPELAKSLSLTVTSEGKCSRTMLEKAYKIIGGLIGENTNTNNLRRENITVRTQR